MSSVDVAAESYGGEYPGNIFDWMRVLLVALARKDLKPEVVALAGFIAFSGDGVSGQECYFDEERLTAEIGKSRATLYRYLAVLEEEGWLEQTRLPSYAGKGSPSRRRRGRQAQYRGSWPTVALRHDLPEQTSLSPAPDDETREALKPCLTTTPDDEIRQPVDNTSRVSNPDLSCLTTTPDDEPLPTCDLPTPHLGHPTASTTGPARDEVRRTG